MAGLSGIDSEACEVDIDGESGLGGIGAKSGIIAGGFDSRRDAGNLGVCFERMWKIGLMFRYLYPKCDSFTPVAIHDRSF